VYKYIDFGNGANQLTLRVKSNGKTGKIRLIPDKPWLSSIASIDMKAFKDNSGWQEITVKTKTITGIHALWLVTQGEEGELFSVDWFKFANSDVELGEIP
jgi:hypothetical protein